MVYQTTVGDNYARMKAVLKTCRFLRADIVITSGGLGPTQGDITKDVCAEIFGRKMKLHEESKRRIDKRFAQRNIVWTDNNLRQVTLLKVQKIFELQWNKHLVDIAK